MHVLTLATQKGGSGKTTLAASLAVAAMQAGETVVLVDIDPQGSLREWHERREAQGKRDVLFRAVDATGLADLLARIRAYRKISLVIIDTAGVFDGAVVEALRRSDMALLPVRPSLVDVRATERTAAALDRIGRPYAFVLNQIDGRSPARAEDAAKALVAMGSLYPDVVALRADHHDAIAEGEGVSEWRPRSPAAVEVEKLWRWVRNEMGMTDGA